jgi:hypothetical protein
MWAIRYPFDIFGNNSFHIRLDLVVIVFDACMQNMTAVAIRDLVRIGPLSYMTDGLV